MQTFLRDRWLQFILSGGVLVRVLFVLFGAKVYYASSQANIYTNGDSHSYIRAFTNLLEHGVYTFDFLEPDAVFGRLPGYPFFYGLHHLIFGSQHAMQAVAWTQVLLDTVSILLVYLALRKIWPLSKWIPRIGALLYAFYPFTIVWVTIIGTETLGAFLILLWLNYLLGMKNLVSNYILLGLLIAVAFYEREYLGALLPISILYLTVNNIKYNRQKWASMTVRMGFFVALSFGLLYVLWPVRNYYSYHRFVLVKPPTAGYANYNVDFASFRSWVQCWTNDEQYWLDNVAKGKGKIDFPSEAFSTGNEEQEAEMLALEARRCGSSFYLYRTGMYATPTYFNVRLMKANREYQNNCNLDISRGFSQLKSNYISKHPLQYWVKVPMLNIKKAFFKSNKNNASKGLQQYLIAAIFLYRTILLLIALVGLIMFYKRTELMPAVLFFGFMYLFISFILRNLEMRYLLQADVMSLLLTASLLGCWLDRKDASKQIAQAKIIT